MSDIISYMGYEWITVENGVVTIGISEEAAEDLSDDLILTLPEQEDAVMAGKVCGDIESENGNLNIYSPVSGTVIEVNEAVLENPALIFEDPTDEGWLFKVEADDTDKLDQISLRAKSFEDDDEDDDDDDDLEEDEDDDDDSKNRD